LNSAGMGAMTDWDAKVVADTLPKDRSSELLKRGLVLAVIWAGRHLPSVAAVCGL